jgi:hypothetical protein
VARAARAHPAHRLLRAVDHRAQVDLQLARDAGLRLLLERRDRHDPGVVDEDVDRAQAALDVVQEGGEAGQVGDVEGEPDDRVAELGGGALRGLAIDVADRHADALGDQRLGDRAPDAPGAAGDDGGLAAQLAGVLGHVASCPPLVTRRQRYRYAPLGR